MVLSRASGPMGPAGAHKGLPYTKSIHINRGRYRSATALVAHHRPHGRQIDPADQERTLNRIATGEGYLRSRFAVSVCHTGASRGVTGSPAPCRLAELALPGREGRAHHCKEFAGHRRIGFVARRRNARARGRERLTAATSAAPPTAAGALATWPEPPPLGLPHRRRRPYPDRPRRRPCRRCPEQQPGSECCQDRRPGSGRCHRSRYRRPSRRG